jgi:hypothetical protein
MGNQADRNEIMDSKWMKQMDIIFCESVKADLKYHINNHVNYQTALNI